MDGISEIYSKRADSSRLQHRCWSRSSPAVLKLLWAVGPFLV